METDLRNHSGDIMTETWLRSRWEKDSRYYEILVQQDLWGSVAANAGLGSAWIGFRPDTP